MAVSIHLKQFDGPLDLLLHLVDKAKIDLRDIFVSEITDQYLSIVRDAEDFDMEEASEFLTMAALLLEIKSRRLLPRKEEETEEEDPEAVLLARLAEYKQFKESTRSMYEFETAARAAFGKLPEEYPLPPPTVELTGLTLQALWSALLRVQERKKQSKSQETPMAPIRSIPREFYSVEECIGLIENRLKEGAVRFETLFSPCPGKEEIVTLFSALLEVLKLGEAHVVQNKVFEEIWIEPGRLEDYAEGDADENDGSAEAVSADY